MLNWYDEVNEESERDVSRSGGSSPRQPLYVVCLWHTTAADIQDTRAGPFHSPDESTTYNTTTFWLHYVDECWYCEHYVQLYSRKSWISQLVL